MIDMSLGAGKDWPVGRLTMCAVAVALAALVVMPVPASASARSGDVSKVVTYITTYTGVYSFIEYVKTVDYAGRASVTTQNQSYVWQEEVKDVIVPRSNGTISENRYTTVDAGGDYDGVFGGVTPSTRHCDYKSQPGHKFKSKVLGNPEGAAPVHGNPLIPYSWTLPEFAGQLGVGSTCGGGGRGEVLAYTPAVKGTVNALFEDTHEFDHAFEGSDSVRFKSMPAMHPITASLHGRKELPNGGYDQAQVRLTGGVKFERWGDPRNNNKVGKLLLDDLLQALGVDASGDGSAMADGKGETILVPGMVPDTVTTEVTGTVTWQHNMLAGDPAARPTTFYTGKATIRGNDAVTLRLTPTSAGRAALAVAHPSIPIHVNATFNPSGNGRNTAQSHAPRKLGARHG